MTVPYKIIPLVNINTSFLISHNLEREYNIIVIAAVPAMEIGTKISFYYTVESLLCSCKACGIMICVEQVLVHTVSEAT